MHAPITALWAGVLGLISLALSIHVVNARRSTDVLFGDGSSTVLQQRIRMHGNFIEYVPIALVLLLVLELNGASALVLNALGASLVVARVLHAIGLSSTTGVSFGRFAGAILTWVVILVASGLAIYAHFA
jgi:uncharacterized membrane protein YecN with MAPEG domain